MLKVLFLLSCLVAIGLCHYYDNSYGIGQGPVFDYGFGRDLGFSGYDGYGSGYGKYYGRGGYGTGIFGRGYGNRWIRRSPTIGGY